jgi:hypothetical protein
VNPDGLGASGRFRWFTYPDTGVWDASTDLDLQTIGKSPTRSITLMSDGVLVVMPASPIDAGTAETSPALEEGTTLEIQATKILKESTVTAVFVQW